MSVFHVLILEFWKWLSALQGAFHPSMVVPCCCCSMSILVTCSIITWKLSSAMPFHCRDTFASCFWAASLCLPGRPQWSWRTVHRFKACLPSTLDFRNHYTGGQFQDVWCSNAWTWRNYNWRSNLGEASLFLGSYFHGVSTSGYFTHASEVMWWCSYSGMVGFIH